MADKIVIISPTLKRREPWTKALKAQNPEMDIEFYPDDTDRKETEFLLVWNPPEGVFDNYPNLKVISSIGAGVTHILKNKSLPEGVPVIKMNDTKQKRNLAVFVLSLLLNRLRCLDHYAHQQAKSLWKRHSYGRPQEHTVGIMGIGNIGQEVGKLLRQNDFSVTGWSRSPKDLPSIKTFYGDDQKHDFLKTADFLVCLLPLTPETQGILNSEVFAQLPENAYLINVGRGSHLVENDLLKALDSGELSGAALDAFQKEPLPEDHPFWSHHKILITPHTASSIDPNRVCKKIYRNYQHMKKGEELEDKIDLSKGY